MAEYEEAKKQENGVSEGELEQVNGGYATDYWGDYDDPKYDDLFRFHVGDHAEYQAVRFVDWVISTDGCTILHRSLDSMRKPCYQCSGIDGVPTTRWLPEYDFE